MSFGLTSERSGRRSMHAVTVAPGASPPAVPGSWVRRRTQLQALLKAFIPAVTDMSPKRHATRLSTVGLEPVVKLS